MKLSFVGVGPMRAGTTWLNAALARHPRVRLPREKETFYFDRYYARGEAWYEAHFPGGEADSIYGEIGASYFHSPAARERIFAHAPDALILVNVRDPVERAYSTFVHLRKTRSLPADAIEAARADPEILDSGAYSVHLPAWEARFGAERVMLVPMEEIKAAPHALLARILARLGLPPLDPSIDLGASVNDAYAPPSPRIHRAQEALFRYLADNHRFRALAAARALKRGAARVAGPLSSLPFSPLHAPRAPRAMTAEERAFFEAQLQGERAFLSQRLAARTPES